jgi:hypothetical protein
MQAKTPLLLVTCYVAYGFALALFSKAGFPSAMSVPPGAPFLCDKPVGEDGFYMLTVAWRLAEGSGLTYNLDKATTGVQPLATFVYAAIAWLVQLFDGDRWAFTRAVICFGTLTATANAWLLALNARTACARPELRPLTFTLALGLSLGSAWLFRAHTYGLETGVYLLLLSACMRATLVLPETPSFHRLVALGALMGLCGLARLDFGVVLAALLLAILVTRKLDLRSVLIIGAVASVTAAPWLLWVRATSNTWMPSSGAAQASTINLGNALDRMWATIAALVGNVVPWIYTGARTAFVLAAVGSAAVLAALAVYRRSGWNIDPSSRTWLLLWSTAVGPLLIVYPAFFWATHFYGRYLSPALVIAVPVLACAGSALLGRSGSVPRFGTHAALAISFYAMMALTLHSGRIGNSHSVSAGIVQRSFSEPRRVGAFQSGVIGFFNPNVVNLDGKMDAKALAHMRASTVSEYIDEERLDVLIDWDSAFGPPNFSPGYLDHNWVRCSVTIANGASVCYERAPTMRAQSK